MQQIPIEILNALRDNCLGYTFQLHAPQRTIIGIDGRAIVMTIDAKFTDRTLINFVEHILENSRKIRRSLNKRKLLPPPDEVQGDGDDDE